ncbi:acyltransferase family protein [Pseudomonas nicosulfuronedens]
MQNRKIADIELLRGVAVLMVVILHTNQELFTWTTPSLARFFTYFGGTSGVDLFFAISGFVIARDLIPRLEMASNREQALKLSIEFWVRRAWRLLPSAWLWLGLTLLAVAFFNQSEAFGSVRANIEATLAAVLQIADFRRAAAFGHFEYGATAHYWSLSLEEKFYLVFPLLCILLRKRLVILVAAVAVVQLLLPRDGYHLLLVCTRLDALCLGVLLAIWSRQSSYELFVPLFLRNRLMGSAFVCVLLFGLLLLGANTLNIVSMRFSVIALLATALVWAASYDRNFICASFGPLAAPLIWLGARSYAIYLIHLPAYYLTRETWFRLSPENPVFGDANFYPFALTAAVLTLALAELNYRLLEIPLRQRGRTVAAQWLSGGGSRSAEKLPGTGRVAVVKEDPRQELRSE